MPYRSLPYCSVPFCVVPYCAVPYCAVIAGFLAISQLAPPALAQTKPALSQTKEEQKQAKELCVSYQNELVALETPALRDRLKQNPQNVASELAQEEIAKLKRLIELDELLMFRCRIGLKPLGVAQNGNGRSALQQAVALPDLPVRRPKIARRRIAPSTIVPLPTRRSDAK